MTLDQNYDLTLRNTVTDQAVYDAGGKNLHLLGIGLDNAAADRCFDEQNARDERDFLASLN